MSKPSTHSRLWLFLPLGLLLPFAVGLLLGALWGGELGQQVINIAVKLVARP